MTKDHDSRKPVSSVESGFDFLDRFRFPTGFARKFGACSVFSFFPRREFYGSWCHQPVAISLQILALRGFMTLLAKLIGKIVYIFEG